MALGVLTVNGGTGSGTYTIGDFADIYATPGPGYTFDHWGDLVWVICDDVNAASTFVQIGWTTCSITAYFTNIDYTLDYVAGTGGSITGDTHQDGLHYGDSGTEVTAVADGTHTFLKWDDGVLTAARTDTCVGNDSRTAFFYLTSGTGYQPGPATSPYMML
jgi:hypothetical protein